MMREFTDRHILITGGSAGIGLAMALEFARRGARLSLVARGEAGLAAAAEELRSGGAVVATYPADVSDAGALAAGVGEAIEELGPLCGVVANSGYCWPGRFHAFEAADIEAQIAVNLTGAALTLRLAMPHLLAAEEGFAAVTSSPAGNAAIAGFSIYGATKAGLNLLLRSLRQEYADTKVSFHLLLPPDVDTPGYAEEVKRYPPETRGLLSGGRLFPADVVGRRFVDGIARGRFRIAVGAEISVLLWAVRYAPWLWEAYARFAIARARKQMEGAEHE